MKSSTAILFLLATTSVAAQLTDCLPPVSQAELDINNVRAQISNGLQHFEDNGDAGYQVPKVPDGEPGIHSIYADALWIGGYSSDEQLHLAAITYRSGGATDYYPGPLRTDGLAESNEDVCDTYDNVYVVDRSDAILHREYQLRLEQVTGGADQSILSQFPFENGYTIPEAFYSWPGVNTNPGYSNYLAPFEDWNSDGIYNPEDGDYPGFDLDGTFDCGDYTVAEQLPLLGHQAAWYVSNDAGLHTETGGTPLGIEIQVTTYGYTSCDALNDATFTRYLIINRSSNSYSDCTIGKWVDTDVGCAEDDYVGCDVARGMAYSYNGDENDTTCAGVLGYGHQRAAIGVTFLAGPHQDADGLDNPLTDDVAQALDEDGIVYSGQGRGYGDGVVDNEQFSARTFVYYRRGSQTGVIVNGEPNIASEFYQYMNGVWKNDVHMTYGGIGFPGTTDTDYMFPGTTDPLGVATDGQIINDEWSEESGAHEPGDRRFLMSTGNFTMDPGEVNELTVAYIWARDESGQTNAVEALNDAHDLIQEHFDNCFDLVTEYPLLTEFELEQNGTEVQASFALYSAEKVNWDFGDGATANGLNVSHSYGAPGYYELCVSHDQCGELRMVCDSIYVSPSEFFPSIQVTRMEGRGCGTNIIELAEGELDSILQGPDYYNAKLTYSQDKGPINVMVYDEDSFVPGDYAIRLFGDDIDYPDQWKLWRVGGTDTIFSDETIDMLYDQYIPQYGLVVSIAQPNHYSPFNSGGVPNLLGCTKTFEDPTIPWLSGVPDTEDNTEQNWIRAGSNFAQVTSPTGCSDSDPTCEVYYYDRPNIDIEEKFENILGGTWAPLHVVANSWAGPAVNGENYQNPSSTKLTDLNNVILKFTSDKSLWTRCAVLENGQFPQLTYNSAEKNHMRRSLSVDKNGLNQLNGGDYAECTRNGTQVFNETMLLEFDSEEIELYIIAAFPGQDPTQFSSSDLVGLSFGMGWFPGYAVDFETGYRLNMMFSEHSGLPTENGADMIWNPTSTVWNSFNQNDPLNARFGGGHYIYVMRNHVLDTPFNLPIRMPAYDYGEFCYNNLEVGNTERKRVFRSVTWVGLPLLDPAHSFLPIAEGLIPTETTIRFNVSKDYRGQLFDDMDEDSERFPLYNFTVPEDLFFTLYDEDLTVDLGVYPNPSSDEIHIALTIPFRTIDQLSIFNYAGKEVRRFTDVNSTSLDLTIGDLASGTYLVQAIDNVGKEHATRFVVR